MGLLTLIILGLIVLSLIIFIASKIKRPMFMPIGSVTQRASIKDKQISESKKQPIDKDVQFTVYRPRAIEPEKWYTLLAITHLSELPDDATKDDVHPKVEVVRTARGILGADVQAYRDITADSKQALPREGLLTFIPDFQNITFVPDRQSFLWRGKTHPVEFSLSAPKDLEGETIRGCVSVYWGLILLAEINLSIEVNSTKANQYQNTPSQSVSFSPYRKIFASYSHSDSLIVEQFEHFADTQGDEYLRDIRDIRAGEVWNERLEELIREADMFQLFWSSNSMSSRFVRQEWEYALSLNRNNFVRPTYWEEPMPVDSVKGLPPEVLLVLQFKRFWFSQDAFTKTTNNPPPQNPTVRKKTFESAQKIISPESSKKTLVLILCFVAFGMSALLYQIRPGRMSNTNLSPTATTRAFYEAAQARDAAAIKNTMSKSSLELMEKFAKMQNKSLDEALRDPISSPELTNLEVRNEAITGDTATVEVMDEKGNWETIPLVKEDGQWKIALDKALQQGPGGPQ